MDRHLVGTLTSYWRPLYWVNFYPNGSAVSFALFLLHLALFTDFLTSPRLSSPGPVALYAWLCFKFPPTLSFFLHRPSPRSSWTPHFPSPFRFPCHCCYTITFTFHSKHMPYSFPPSHLNFFTYSSKFEYFIWYYIWPSYLQLFF